MMMIKIIESLLFMLIPIMFTAAIFVYGTHYSELLKVITLYPETDLDPLSDVDT